MIELLAFNLNSGSDDAFDLSCEFSATRPTMTVLFLDSTREYDLTCGICLVSFLFYFLLHVNKLKQIKITIKT